MSCFISRVVVALGSVALLSAPAPGQQNAQFAPTFKRFADAHCVECHGPDVQKSRLRLDTLAANFDEKDIAATWVKVLDKLAAGQMPPKKKARPPAAELNAIVAELNAHLHDASLARQRSEGR